MVYLLDINFVLAAQVIGKTDMELLTLTKEGEVGLWGLVPSDIVDSVGTPIVGCHYVLAHDGVSHFTFIVSTTSLITLFYYSYLVE